MRSAGAAGALNERERDDGDDEIARLKSKVGEITMDNELFYAKIAAMEGKRPLVPQEVETMSQAASGRGRVGVLLGLVANDPEGRGRPGLSRRGVSDRDRPAHRLPAGHGR